MALCPRVQGLASVVPGCGGQTRWRKACVYGVSFMRVLSRWTSKMLIDK